MWICGVDNDTTYSEGTGLDLSAGNAFSIEPDYRVKNTPDCSSGQFATGFDGDGDIQCVAAPTPAPTVRVARVARADAPQVVAGTSGPVIASLSVPAGSYLVHTTLVAHDDAGGDDLEVVCFLTPQGVSSEPAASGGVVADESATAGHSMAITEVITLTAAGEIRLRCQSRVGSDHVQSVRLTALTVSIG